MAKYLTKRILYAILILWGVVTLIFFLFNILPGDPARMLMGQRSDQASMEAIRKDLGMDRSKGLQYLKYLNDLSPLSFHSNDSADYFYLDNYKYAPYTKIIKGKATSMILKTPYLRRSYQSRVEVMQIIGQTFPNTFILALTSIVFASLIGIFIGVLTAIYKDSLFDRLAIFFSAFGMSLPSFFAAILIGFLFAFKWGDWTGLNLTGNLYEVDDFGEGVHLQLKNLILPALTLGIRPLAIVIQLSRNSLLDVLSQDYIRTAWAKGLKYPKILIKHALRNALNPVITAVSGWFASMMAGIVFVEYIFGWKGMGYVIVDALNNYDLPVVMGVVITIAIIFIVINILVDIAYAILDPRIRLG